MKLFLFFISIFMLASPISAEIETGEPAVNFSLNDVHGKAHSLSDYEGKYRVLEWTNHECPFVKKHYSSNNMQSLQKKYAARGVVWLTINSSAPGKQGHFSTGEWKSLLQEKGSRATATLLDPDGTVGRTYSAKTTPHLFIVSPEGFLIYQGAIDDVSSTNPDDIPDARNYVAQALDEAMSGKPVSMESTRAYGCSVKY